MTARQHGGRRSRTGRLAATLYGLLLRAYPEGLRREYGDELREVFLWRLERSRRRGGWSAMTLWVRELRDVAAHLSPIGRDPRRELPPPQRRSPRERLADAMDLFLQDLRFAARSFLKRPGFTLVAILVLALGIGANAAMFSVVHRVLLQPLPFEEPDRLVAIWEKNPERGWHQAQVAAANYLDWRARADAFTAMAAHNDWLVEKALTGRGAPEILAANEVTGNFFAALGVDPVVGTGFSPSDDWGGGERKVILAHHTWQARFGGDADVVGTRLDLDREPHTVVGVAPAGFRYPFPEVEAWVPVAWDSDFRGQVWFRRAHGMRVIGRLAPGVSHEEAEAELEAIAANLEAEYPETNVAMGTGITPLHEWIVGDTRTPVLLLFAAVGLVLLIACANVANMQLARASRRNREMTVRAALGAGRRRLLAQGLTESLLLAALGGLAGIGLGLALVRMVAASSPPGILGLDRLSLDPTVLAFAVAVTALTGLAFGLVPALRASAAGAGAMSGRASAGRRENRASTLLVMAEVALVLPLAVGAGLLVRSLGELQTTDPGFDPAGLVAFGYSLPDGSYPESEDVAEFHRRLLERAGQIPGVEHVGISTRLPFHQQRWGSDFRAESWPPDRFGINVRHDEVAGPIFRTMGVRVLAGATFADADLDSRLVAVVNRALAEEYFPDGDVVGERLCFSRQVEDCRYWFEVIGVVDNVRRVSLAEEEEPSIYASVLQDTTSAGYLLVRSSRSTEDVVTAVEAAVGELDPALPFHTVTTLDSLVDDSVARTRLLLRVVGAFAAVALLLAAFGVYGVVAYTTARRTREIGVRVSLGAGPRDVLRAVFARSLLPVAIGTGVGLAVAAVSSRLLGEFLYRVSEVDPVTYGTVAATVVATAALACILPARRALRIDPIEALDGE